MELQFREEPYVFVAAFGVEPKRLVRAQLALHTPGVPDFTWMGTASLGDAQEAATVSDDFAHFGRHAYNDLMAGWFDITAPQLF